MIVGYLCHFSYVDIISIAIPKLLYYWIITHHLEKVLRNKLPAGNLPFGLSVYRLGPKPRLDYPIGGVCDFPQKLNTDWAFAAPLRFTLCPTTPASRHPS